MTRTNRIELESMAIKITEARDELNLAEFPLSALAHRLRPEQKTLRFGDCVWDDRHGKTIHRQLTITGSDAYGLPTALDDEVLLGLIQLTKLRGFTDRKVSFTRYQLIDVLGWRPESKSYARLEASLNRWTGVTLYYDNAWWHKARQCWVDEKFHVLDNVWLLHRAERRWDGAEGEETAQLSAFTWNEVIFRSFQAGNLKAIDFDFFKALKSAIAKRVYRFLDKRFFHRPRWEFNLQEFAWEHVGLARGYDSASLKRKLRSGIGELEEKGYLHRLPDHERFRKDPTGEWRVVFAKAPADALPAKHTGDATHAEAIVSALIGRGVTPDTARQTVRQHLPEKIKSQIEVFDWMIARKDPKVSRNPPGFLISAIRGEYLPPRDFVSQQAQAKQARQAAARKRSAEKRRQERIAREQVNESKRERTIQTFWQSISEEQKGQIECEALANATVFQRKLMLGDGQSAAAARKAVMDAYVLSKLPGQN